MTEHRTQQGKNTSSPSSQGGSQMVREGKRMVSMKDLPFLPMPYPAMEVFDPAIIPAESSIPAGRLPLCHAARLFPQKTFIPRYEDCVALWDAYAMFDNIRQHSIKVACLAKDIAIMLCKKGSHVSPDAAFAAGMLHDLGKTYSVKHGGSHAQIGSAWVMQETRNGPIARAVLLHVHWLWEGLLEKCARNDDFFLTSVIEYSDKRVKHDEYVSIDERYDDLQVRYGKTDFARKSIEASRQQGKALGRIFSERLEMDLETYTPDCGRLVI